MSVPVISLSIILNYTFYIFSAFIFENEPDKTSENTVCKLH